MRKGFKVIDADAHMHEPREMWERYSESKFKDRAPKVAHINGTFITELDGLSTRMPQWKYPGKDWVWHERVSSSVRLGAPLALGVGFSNGSPGTRYQSPVGYRGTKRSVTHPVRV